MNIIYLFLVLFAPFSLAQNKQCAESCTSSLTCLRTYTISDKTFYYYSNFPINESNSCIDKVIYVVHGVSRNAWSRYNAVLDAAKSKGRQNNVLIISPYFKTDGDSPGANDLYWSSHGWKQGNTSNNNGKHVSSFAVADLILKDVFSQGNFTNLHSATVTGHSAGGQYTQMYALTSFLPKDFPQISFNFLVLNPSNYTYLNALRPHPYYWDIFELPVYEKKGVLRMKTPYRRIAGNCPNSYDDYKYGMKDRNGYSKDISDQTLIEQYSERNVFYFLGEEDANENDDSMDTSCEAKLQGRHRLERGINYYYFVKQFYPGNPHQIGIVEGVGHDARKMYDADIVKDQLLYDNKTQKRK